ncbi:MAG: oligosaccharide flippase family protein, partial [Bacteroidota bacterium]
MFDRFDDIKKLFVKGSFIQNVGFSMGGNAIVLGIGFFLTPVIARIYGPQAYGQFAIFTAIISIIQPISTFQLQAGYVAAKNDAQFANLIKLSFIILLIVSALSLAGGLVYYSFGNISILPTQLALLIPLYIFFSGVFNIFRGWNIKLEEFKRSAQSKTVATLFGKSTTLGYGWFINQSAIGMIFGSIVTFIFESLGYISHNMFNSMSQVLKAKTSFSSLKLTLSDFINYPRYVTFNSVINNLSAQIPIYFIAAWYSTEKVGLFSLAISLLTIPVNLIGTSIGAVFLPKISSIIDDVEKRKAALLELYKKLFYPGLIGLIILAILLKFLLPAILGVKWDGASQLSAFVAISFAFTIVALPISVTYRLIHYEHTNLVLTIFFIIFKVVGLAIGLFYDNFILSVFGYFIATVLHHSSQIFLLFR